MKKPKKKNKISPLLFLPFIFLGLLCFFIIFLVSTHNTSLFIKYFYYLLIASFAAIEYLLLSPLHELGHYFIAKKIMKQKNLNVKLWISFNNTSCNNWKAFEENDCKKILKSGILFKIIYCAIFLIIGLVTKDKEILLIFAIVILVECHFNWTSFHKDSDYYKYNNLEIFYKEKIKKSSKFSEIFISKIYLFFLIIISIFAIIKLFYEPNVINKLFQLLTSESVKNIFT